MLDKAIALHEGKKYLKNIVYAFLFNVVFLIVTYGLVRALSEKPDMTSFNQFVLKGPVISAALIIGVGIATFVTGIGMFVEVFPISIGTSKTRTQFLFTTIITNVAIAVVMAVLLVGILYLELTIKKIDGYFIKILLNELGDVNNIAILIGLLVRGVAGSGLIGYLSYKFEKWFWIPLGSFYIFGPMIAFIPFVRSILLNIMSVPFINKVVLFVSSNDFVPAMTVALICFVITILGTMRLVPKDKSAA
ncbi:hypothetical protein [Guggenheimella bovis]